MFVMVMVVVPLTVMVVVMVVIVGVFPPERLGAEVIHVGGVILTVHPRPSFESSASACLERSEGSP